MWSPWSQSGLEHLRLAWDLEGASADGLIVRALEGQAFRAHYVLRCDGQWRVREVRVTLLGSEQPGIHLLADGEGHWTVAGGESVPALDGCIDVDIAVTPFTNTLPIRRLKLQPGESAELKMVYIDVPELHLAAERQQYTCLEARPANGPYRFEALPSGFTADLPVDADGLVTDYPGLFRRVWLE